MPELGALGVQRLRAGRRLVARGSGCQELVFVSTSIGWQLAAVEYA